ncbi:NADH dehydrogenase subunit 2 (mitochondrion) [Hermetia illucens]|uniref:NADH-ubiquinone oxidoreductase chain 2 n=1 Tax=Hermetia illucens TaxID=343691 RepID=A0A343DCU8_HERIL|nr:NADH dehydrogenase subunit 2 [Hermetia illucens]ARV86550.1 NADH dehydrogenase subunit 2 [Hermetia illucens]
MFNNSTKILFFLTLISGTLITISSSSWLSAWMGLEINLLSFIPLMNSTNNLLSSETALKYFLTQAIASSIFLVAVIISMLKTNMFPQLVLNYNNLITTALLIKSGTAPFHFWFPSVMDGLSWTNSLILMTWQKIAPLVLVTYIYSLNLMIFFIISSALVGALGGLNQTSLRKLMAFSSINHLGWMLAAMADSNKLWLIYFIFYVFLSTAIIFMFNLFKTFHLNQIYSLSIQSTILKFCLFINLLSLGGLPPFLGFFPKWMIIQQLSTMNYMFMTFVLIMSSLITLFFYLRLCYPAFLLGKTEHSWIKIIPVSTLPNKTSLIFSFISTMGLPLISLLIFIF